MNLNPESIIQTTLRPRARHSQAWQTSEYWLSVIGCQLSGQIFSPDNQLLIIVFYTKGVQTCIKLDSWECL